MEVTVGVKVKQLQGLVGTSDVNRRQEEFIENMNLQTHGGTKTSHLTGPQIEFIESLWKRHYGY